MSNNFLDKDGNVVGPMDFNLGLGRKAAANTRSFNLATDDNANLLATSTALGAPADTSATTDTGTFSLIALFKRALGYLATIATNASSTAPSAVVGPGGWEYIPASTTQVMGGSGALGDYLSHVTITPTSTTPGAVQIQDGGGTARTIFAGGASSVSNLVPFAVPLGLTSLAGAWTIITNANETAIAVGRFT